MNTKGQRLSIIGQMPLALTPITKIVVGRIRQFRFEMSFVCSGIKKIKLWSPSQQRPAEVQ